MAPKLRVWIGGAILAFAVAGLFVTQVKYWNERSQIPKTPVEKLEPIPFHFAAPVLTPVRIHTKIDPRQTPWRLFSSPPVEFNPKD